MYGLRCARWDATLNLVLLVSSLVYLVFQDYPLLQESLDQENPDAGSVAQRSSHLQ